MNRRYYVDTKSTNPQAIWTHPLDFDPGPTTPSLYTTVSHTDHSTPSSPSSLATGEPANPDTRPLPPGYISQYSHKHKTFFYVDEYAADPDSTVTWTHPAALVVDARQNPDKRKLPPGWKTDYDFKYEAWFYINTNDASATSSWTHPADTHNPSAIYPIQPGRYIITNVKHANSALLSNDNDGDSLQARYRQHTSGEEVSLLPVPSCPLLFLY